MNCIVDKTKGKPKLIFSDPSGKRYSFTQTVPPGLTDEQLTKYAEREQRRVKDLYDTYDSMTKLLLNKPLKIKKEK